MSDLHSTKPPADHTRPKRLACRSCFLALLASTALAAGAPPVGAQHVASSGSGRVVDLPVSFEVRNVNRSKVACPSDGRTYAVRGRLVAPRSALAGRGGRALTVYQHGSQVGGQVLWRFRARPGYDYAHAMARRGHASLVFDNLGYGSSAIPNGTLVCLGSMADVDHQVIASLRRGDYDLAGGRGIPFRRIALAGISMGGLLVEVEAYSFHDIDALIVMGYSGTPSTELAVELGRAAPPCARGGDPKRSGSSPGYFMFLEGNDERLFFNAEPEVVAGWRAAHERDVCGFYAALPGLIAADPIGIGSIRVPVLVAFGRQDAWFSGYDEQASKYTGSHDVSSIGVENAGHIPFLERPAPEFRARISAWLRERGF